MRKVYLSFLGLGTFDPVTKTSRYMPTVYELNKEKSPKTEFVQVAEIKMMGTDYFDKVIIACTQKSFDTHFENLKNQLENIGVSQISPLIIGEDMSSEGQWNWFEQILLYIDPNDELTIDLTHGYRSAPIVISAAINFLRRSRNIALNAVYYGAYEKDKGLAPIVNMKDFYIINEWAEAVSRLVEDADARKLAELAKKTPEFQFGELNDNELISIFDKLTNTIRNVDVNNVSGQANQAISLIKNKLQIASGTGKILLKLVLDKFSSLATEEPLSGRYDKPYFTVQLEIIRLLLTHKLFMQAYTVMRELIASIGMIPFKIEGLKDHERREKRRIFGEMFTSMFHFKEKKWKFEGEQKKAAFTELKPYYDKLKDSGIEKILRDFSGDLANYRNGFDHAWTATSGAESDIEEKGLKFYESLKEVVDLLDKNSFFG